MSLRAKIDAYRRLKRISAERRHLYTKLLTNIESYRLSRNVASASPLRNFLSEPHPRKYISTRISDEKCNAHRAAVSVPIHERCSLCVSDQQGTSQEEAELRAITSALNIIPSPTEWARLTQVLDSDLFVAFTSLLSCLNAQTVIQLARKLPLSRGCDEMNNYTTADCGLRFRATVAVELASTDFVEVRHEMREDLCSIKADTSSSIYVSNSPSALAETQMPTHLYDIGITSDWVQNAHDAVKLAIFESLDILQEEARKEWHEAGKEGALVLNEIRCGAGCTSEMDVQMLNNTLRRSYNLGDRSNASKMEELRFRCVSKIERNCDSRAFETGENVSSASREPWESHRTNIDVMGWKKTRELCGDLQSPTPLFIDQVSVFLHFPPTRVPYPHIGEQNHRNALPSITLSWPFECLAGATLLAIATDKAALYRCVPFSKGVAARISSDAKEIHSSCCLSRFHDTTVIFNRKFIPLFAALSCGRHATIKGIPLSAALPYSSGDALCCSHNAESQNQWHFPDVVAMLASLRAALSLPAHSYPIIHFEQTAFHDPAKRVRELRTGLYGDVDIFTKVQVQWNTPQGSFTACAVSDPALHGSSYSEQDSKKGSLNNLWISCADTGIPRGPFPLLVSAICCLYDQVLSRITAADARSSQYPLLSARSPFSRKTLDSVMSTWFEAPPQIRYYVISTTPPKEVESAEATAAEYRGDGSLHHEVGPSIIRAMLFYDFLGQRVLFAETHAENTADAAARLNQLAVELNCIPYDHRAFFSTVARRGFRSVPQQQRRQRTFEVLERKLQLCCSATLSTPFEGGAVKVKEGGSARRCDRALSKAFQACIAASGSEVDALWTVLTVLMKTVADSAAVHHRECDGGGGREKGREYYSPAPLLSTDYQPDIPGREDMFSGEEHGGSGTGVASTAGVGGVKWEGSPPGNEAVFPPAGVMWLRLCRGGRRLDSTYPVRVDFCCRVIPQRCSTDPAQVVWIQGAPAASARTASNEVRFVASTSSAMGQASAVAATVSGILPALVLLCRQALLYVYDHWIPTSLAATRLPHREDVLSWCAAVGPVFARVDDGYPPYNPRFYTAPRLLGELLQGIAGRYECCYSRVPSRTPAKDRRGDGREGHERGGRSAPSASPTPTTIFYTSKPLRVDATADAYDEDAAMILTTAPMGSYEGDRQRSSSRTAPPAIACTLYIDSIFGQRAVASPSPDLRLQREPSELGYVLGHGLGRTKREAWRSAAWQALRLQFPDALRQLEAYKDISELMQHPAMISRLVHEDSSASVTRVCYKLLFNWAEVPLPRCEDPMTPNLLQSSVRSRVSCRVVVAGTDGSRRSVVPYSVATSAASAGEAYATAVATLLRKLRRATHQGETADITVKATAATVADALSNELPKGIQGWATSRLAPTYATCAAWSSPHRHPGAYASWRRTTHYGKSVWHAYGGALSVYMETDVAIRLLYSSDAAVKEGDTEHARAGALRIGWTRAVALGKVQVRLRYPPLMENAEILREKEQQRDMVATTAATTGGIGCFGDPTFNPIPTDVAHGVLHERTAASFIAAIAEAHKISSFLPSSTSQDAARAVTTTSSSLRPLALLREMTFWLRDVVQACILSPSLQEELHGLLCGRASDVARIRASHRWTLVARTEALLQQWLGRRTLVYVHRCAYPAREDGLATSSVMWVAEALVWIERDALPAHPGLSSSSSSLQNGDDDDAHRDTHPRQWQCTGEETAGFSRPWTLAQAVGATSEQAAQQLYADVSDAISDVLPTEPPPSSSSSQERAMTKKRPPPPEGR